METISLRRYADHRGVHPHSVEIAIRNGRLPSAKKVDGKWCIDPETADREWLANTDSRQQRTATRRELGRTPAAQQPTKALRASESLGFVMRPAAARPPAQRSAAPALDQADLLNAVSESRLLEVCIPDLKRVIYEPVKKVARELLENVPPEFQMAALAEVLLLITEEQAAKLDREWQP